MKDHPVSFNVERMNITHAEVEAHLAHAHRLRSRELGRLSGALFRAPAGLLRRLGGGLGGGPGGRLGGGRSRRDVRRERHA